MVGVSILWSLLTGCKKNEAVVDIPVPGTNATTEVSHAPLYSAPATPPSPAMNSAGTPDFAEMNREVRRWVLSNRRKPKNFEEIAASAGARFPPPPPGKKYALDNGMHVILVKN